MPGVKMPKDRYTSKTHKVKGKKAPMHSCSPKARGRKK